MTTKKNHCLIVGMGSGLSMAIAQRFAANGFSVGAISRGTENLVGLGTAIQSRVQFHAETADAADEEALKRAISGCEQRLGPASVLIYNVGQMTFKPLMETTQHEFHHSFAVNAGGALTSVKAVLPRMIAERKGTILLTGGGLALYPAAGFGMLGVGKAGLRSLALTLAKEVKEARVHVATVTIAGMIQPGTFFAPEMIAEVYWQLHSEQQEQFREEVIYHEGSAL